MRKQMRDLWRKIDLPLLIVLVILSLGLSFFCLYLAIANPMWFYRIWHIKHRDEGFRVLCGFSAAAYIALVAWFFGQLVLFWLKYRNQPRRAHGHE